MENLNFSFEKPYGTKLIPEKELKQSLRALDVLTFDLRVGGSHLRRKHTRCD